MSDSTESTVPVTPPALWNALLNQDIDDVFAWLKPTNPVACNAFNDLVNAAIEQPTTYKHVHQFLHTNPEPFNRGASVFTDNATQDDESESSQEELQWSGAFKFSLKVLPRVGGNGWSLGTGHGLPEDEGVDLMITSHSKRNLKNIAGRHARFYFHKESARLMIEARHTVKLSGMNGADVITKSASRVLEKGHFISIGDCLYAFEYTDYMKSEDFLDQLSNFMESHHGPGWTLHKTLSSASSQDYISLGNYTCTPGAFAAGTFGEVGAGWARNGRAVAIKRFKTPREESLKAHCAMMNYIGEHVGITRSLTNTRTNIIKDNILTLLECISNFNLKHPGAFCVYQPLAMASLSEVISHYTSDIFAQSTLLVDFL